MTDLFSRYINSNYISFKHAKGVSDRSGKEFHLFHEIILFLDGDAELITETIHIKLKPQTLIVIPKETYHQVIIKGKKDQYTRCVFQFYETESNCNFLNTCISETLITECDKSVLFLFDKIISSCKNEDREFCVNICESVLTLLLNEIRLKQSIEIESELNDPLTKQAIDFIAQRLTENLSIEYIAKSLNVSESTLMHTFRKNMNIPIHKYIIKKRLILAHSKISSGEPANVVSTECGFNDYSGFYRQYKKMFDISPSQFKEQKSKETAK